VLKKLIIIPAYNESSNIEGTVAAIKKDAPDFDYIIINDCSTDNSLSMIVRQIIRLKFVTKITLM